MRRARAESHGHAEELKAWLAERTAKWWVPERWSFINEVPKTSVGKFDKKVLRARHAADHLDVQTLSYLEAAVLPSAASAPRRAHPIRACEARH